MQMTLLVEPLWSIFFLNFLSLHLEPYQEKR